MKATVITHPLAVERDSNGSAEYCGVALRAVLDGATFILVASDPEAMLKVMGQFRSPMPEIDWAKVKPCRVVKAAIAKATGSAS